MSTCAICLRPAPVGYGQCRDCIATFGVKENPAEYRRELHGLTPPKPWKLKTLGEEKKMERSERLKKFEEAEKLQGEGDVAGLLKMHQEQETERLKPLREEARVNLRRMSQRFVRVHRLYRLLRAPKFVWVLLAVYLGCAAAEHLSMAGVYFLDVHARVIRGNRAP